MSSFGDIWKSLRPTRTNRFRVILLCMAAATTFWFLNAMNKEHSATLNYPIQFVYDDKTYMAVEELPSDVAINVNGVGWNLLRNNLGIKTSPLLITLDNPVETKTLSALSIRSLISDQISEFRLNYVLTDTLNIQIDEKSTRVFHLYLDSLSVELDDGFRIISPVRISPDTVVFHGPKKLMESMRDTIDLTIGDDAINENFNQSMSVPIPDHITSSDPPIVSVDFEVAEFVQEQVEVPLKLINQDDSDSLSTDITISISYSVESSRADMIGEEDFVVIGDLSVLNEDSIITPRLARYPLGLMDLSYDSAAVSLKRDE